MGEDLARFQVVDAFWETLRAQGYDGYDCIECAQKKRWEAIPDWGKEKWLLGDWPIVIVFFRNRPGCYEVACYMEGERERFTPAPQRRSATRLRTNWLSSTGKNRAKAG